MTLLPLHLVVNWPVFTILLACIIDDVYTGIGKRTWLAVSTACLFEKFTFKVKVTDQGHGLKCAFSTINHVTRWCIHSKSSEGSTSVHTTLTICCLSVEFFLLKWPVRPRVSEKLTVTPSVRASVNYAIRVLERSWRSPAIKFSIRQQSYTVITVCLFVAASRLISVDLSTELLRQLIQSASTGGSLVWLVILTALPVYKPHRRLRRRLVTQSNDKSGGR